MMDEHDREEGVNFESIDSMLESLTYPITKSALVAEYGDRRIERTSSDPIRIADLFDGMGDERFESTEDLRHSVLNYMPKESVGRQRYSDRGGQTRDERERTDESL